MAKTHIQDMARELAKKYKEAEQLMLDGGEFLQYSVLSPEEQASFSKLKQNLDGSLSTLSVALSAAAQGKISELILSVDEERKSYAEPLSQLVDDLSKSDISEETKVSTYQLISSYNTALRSIASTLSTLEQVAFIANFPRNKRKQRRLLTPLAAPLSTRLQEFYRTHYIFTKVDSSMSELSNYIASLKTELAVPTELDDLSE